MCPLQHGVTVIPAVHYSIFSTGWHAEGGAVPAPLGVGATPERAERADITACLMRASALNSQKMGPLLNAPARRLGG